MGYGIGEDEDIYNKDIDREDIVAGIKALGIGLKKNMSLY